MTARSGTSGIARERELDGPPEAGSGMLDGLDEQELVCGIAARDEVAVRAMTTRYNQRLYRIARAILRDDHEAEDVVQETYVRAFTSVSGFKGESSFGTWLVRIAMNEALGRLRRARPMVAWADETESALHDDILKLPAASAGLDPERMMAQREIQALLERSIDELPDQFRAVFVARLVEGMSIDETADLLGVRPETVKTRLHRARLHVRRDLDRQLGAAITETFPFNGARCERLTNAVLVRLGFGR